MNGINSNPKLRIQELCCSSVPFLHGGVSSLMLSFRGQRILHFPPSSVPSLLSNVPFSWEKMKHSSLAEFSTALRCETRAILKNNDFVSRALGRLLKQKDREGPLDLCRAGLPHFEVRT